ncbi:hypothetical protein A2U01_0110389, partial [Trifolium medium]|nr:hypothetical protein [Trifolium medium]
TMLMTVGIQELRLPVTTVRSCAIMLEIARTRGPNRQQPHHKRVDPQLEDMSTVWAPK